MFWESNIYHVSIALYITTIYQANVVGNLHYNSYLLKSYPVYSGIHLMGQCQPSGTPFKTHLILLEMCEISFVDAAMSRA